MKLLVVKQMATNRKLQFGLLLLLILSGSHLAAQTVTPNLGLTLPVQNAPNWGVTLNNNFTLIDTFAGTVKVTWPPSGTLLVSNGANAPAGLVPVNGQCAVGSAGVWTVGSCGASINFSAIVGSTNTTAAMIVGTGASLSVTGSGTIAATSAPLSGISGLGTGVATFLGTPSSANLAAAIADGTGTGANVFANTPTLITPVIGAATGTSLSLSGTGALTLSAMTGTTCLEQISGVVTSTGSACSTGDTITSPHSTIVVGGTSAATQLDLAGAAGQIMAGATPALTATPSLGTDNSAAGTLQLANGSAAAHTIWGSGATTSNTILGFATAPTTGDLVTCTTSSTTCTLTDSAILATNVVTLAGSQTLTNKTLTSPILGGTPDASGATQFKLPVAASGASAANGEKIYDTTNNNWHTWANGVDNIEVLVPASVTITNGDCMQWTKVSGVITASDSGSACGSGGGGTAFSSLTNGTNTAAAMVVGTGASLSASGSGSITATAIAVGGITGLGTGVATFLATPSSANLAAAVTGATGSGALVFATSPTLVTPTLGAATATSIDKVAITAPATSATLTIANGATLQQTGAFTLNLTVAGNATPTFPTASDTVVELTQTQTLTNKTLTSPVLGGTPDASGATQFKLPVASAFVSAANGELGYDTTNKNWHVWGNGVDNFMALVPVSTSPVNSDCVNWVVAGGLVTLGDAGAACGAGGSSSWSSLTNPSTSLTLSMGIHPSTFNFTSALSNAFLWANTTAATSGTSQSSPILSLCGNAWHGGASVQDCLTLEDQPGNGTDAAITFSFAHTGTSTGTVTSLFPGPVQAGSSGGVGGTLNLPEGTTTNGSANNDTCYADSTLHGIKCSFNNGSFLPLNLSPASVTSGDAPSYNGTGGGLFQDSGVSLTNSSVGIPSGQCFSINGDTFLCRNAANTWEIGSSANTSTGVLLTTDVTTLFKTSTLFTQLIGTTFTTSNGCSESGTLVGEGVGGHLTAETSVACSTTITMGGGASATHGWVCSGVDATTSTHGVTIVPASATTVTLSGTFLSGDVIWFSCQAV